MEQVKNNEHEEPFNFRIYLIIVYELLQNEKISTMEAVQAMLYIRYCMNSIPVKADKALDKLIADELFVLVADPAQWADLVIPGAKKCFKIFQAIIKDAKKKKGSLMRFEEFVASQEQE